MYGLLVAIIVIVSEEIEYSQLDNEIGQDSTRSTIPRVSLCIQYRNTHPLGFALGSRASILHTNLGELVNNYYIQVL